MGLFDVFDTKPEVGERKSLGSMLASLPDLISRLIRGEIALARAELIAKLKVAGRGIGLLVGAAVFGFILLEVLIAAAILGTATVFPTWLAALLVAAALLVITAALAFVGYRSLKQGVPPVPSETIKNVRSDVHALKGDAAKAGSTKASATKAGPAKDAPEGDAK